MAESTWGTGRKAILETFSRTSIRQKNPAVMASRPYSSLPGAAFSLRANSHWYISTAISKGRESCR